MTNHGWEVVPVIGLTTLHFSVRRNGRYVELFDTEREALAHIGLTDPDVEAVNGQPLS